MVMLTQMRFLTINPNDLPLAKELFFSGQQRRTMDRLLNLGIAPLLMIFFLTVASRLAEVIN